MPDPPTEPDRRAAHAFLTELRTRIATQALPYQHGREDRALASLVELFAELRKVIRAEPGCAQFAALADARMNTVLRPFTAKWHRLDVEGVLASRDGGDAFRRELVGVQEEMRDFARELHRMAYDSEWVEATMPPVLSEAELDELFEPLPSGIPESPRCNGGIPAEVARAINAAEKEEVSKRPHRNAEQPALSDAFGLALSGGGIRSATFGLGVVQVLAKEGLLDEVDYLSTVSGGGYTGSFVTQVLGGGGSSADLASPGGPDTPVLKRLRMRAKYLAAGSLWRAWGMVATNLGGLVLNWTVPLLVLTVLAAGLVFARKCGCPWSWPWLVFGSLALAGVAGLFHFALLRGGKSAAKACGVGFSGGLAAALGFTVGAGLNRLLVPFFLPAGGDGFAKPSDACIHLQGSWDRLHDRLAWYQEALGWSSAGLGLFAVLLPVVLRFVPLLRNPTARKLVIKIALFVAGIFIPLLGVLVFCLLCTLGSIGSLGGPWLLVGLALALTLIAIFVLNINLTGPHHLYRAGLSRTFVEIEGKEGETPLAEINPQGRAPYHLLNAAVNLPTSSAETLRERKCDFFLFSKRWTGSPATDYRPSGEWSMNGRPADLASAMAISGAAFSSAMGLGSIPPLRALLTFLNVRLGFWIRRPHAPKLWKFPKWQHPGFLCLLREMTGIGMAEEDRWVNLSDGGHIENLALYELLRRRCKFIVAIDGEADPQHSFHGLMTLVRHARIDLGVRIEPDLAELRPDPETGLCRSHFHLCRVHYPASADGAKDGGTGLLLYLKLSLTGNESELIRRYRGKHPEFPHQTTLDQFFDQEQFEAYRQLGVHVGEGVVDLASDPPTRPGEPRDGGAAASAAASATGGFFRSLAGSLLLPESPKPPGAL